MKYSNIRCAAKLKKLKTTEYYAKNYIENKCKMHFQKKSDSKKSQIGESREGPHLMANKCPKWRKFGLLNSILNLPRTKYKYFAKNPNLGGSSSGNTKPGVEYVIVRVPAQSAHCLTSIKSPARQSVSQGRSP